MWLLEVFVCLVAPNGEPRHCYRAEIPPQERLFSEERSCREHGNTIALPRVQAIKKAGLPPSATGILDLIVCVNITDRRPQI